MSRRGTSCRCRHVSPVFVTRHLFDLHYIDPYKAARRVPPIIKNYADAGVEAEVEVV